MWCDICKKMIPKDKVEQHFDKHLKKDDLRRYCIYKEKRR